MIYESGKDKQKRPAADADEPDKYTSYIEYALNERYFDVYIELLLDDNRIREALGAVSQKPNCPDDIVLCVADIARRNYPAEAALLYRRLAEIYIGRKRRERYREACEILRKMRSTMRADGDGDAWDRYLDSLMDLHHRRWALREELRSAGLI